VVDQRNGEFFAEVFLVTHGATKKPLLETPITLGNYKTTAQVGIHFPKFSFELRTVLKDYWILPKFSKESLFST